MSYCRRRAGRAAAACCSYAFGTTRVGLQKDDAGQYYQMAESPTFLARLPYTFRVLTPALASLWPGDPLPGFTLVTLLSLVLAATALYAYQRAVGLARAGRAGRRDAVRRLGRPDPDADDPRLRRRRHLSAEAAGFWFLAAGQFWPFVAAVTVGVLNRETALLLVVLYLVADAAGAGRPGSAQPSSSCYRVRCSLSSSSPSSRPVVS